MSLSTASEDLRTAVRETADQPSVFRTSSSAGRRCGRVIASRTASEAVYALGVKNPITVTKVPDGVVYVQVTSEVGSNGWMPRLSVSSTPPGPRGRRSMIRL